MSVNIPATYEALYGRPLSGEVATEIVAGVKLHVADATAEEFVSALRSLASVPRWEHRGPTAGEVAEAIREARAGRATDKASRLTEYASRLDRCADPAEAWRIITSPELVDDRRALAEHCDKNGIPYTRPSFARATL